MLVFLTNLNNLDVYNENNMIKRIRFSFWFFSQKLKFYLSKFYRALHLYEIPFFFFYICHRYQATQMDLRHVTSNVHILLQVKNNEGLDANRAGKLRILHTWWQKILFSLRNMALLGAPMSRVEKIVYYTYVTLTLELNNPFDKKVLMFFLEKKISLLNRLLSHVERINGRIWDQSMIKLHIQAFQRNSLLQLKVIENIHKAVKRQGIPPVIQNANRALKKGYYPLLITMGCSGAYWMRGEKREILGLFKPFDEEIHAPNNPIGPTFQGALGQRRTRRGCRVGEAANREVGAYLVDAFFGFGIVPRTYFAAFSHQTFFLAREDRLASFRPPKAKYGSFQEFIEGFIPLTKVFDEEKDRLPQVDFQLLIILDVIIGNTDRNTGNIMLGDEKLAAIDHGLCFPDVNANLSYWYWRLREEPLVPSLIDLLEEFPFERLFAKLAKNCFISCNSLSRIRERVVLFRSGTRAGLTPKQMIELMKEEYLYPLEDFVETLEEKAKEQIELFKNTLV